MNLDLRRGAAAAALLLLLLATASDQGVKVPAPERPVSGGGITAIHAAARVIVRWPETSRALAGVLLEKYGIPDEMVASQLSWNDRRPWTRIVVFRDADAAGGSNHLMESVAYGKVPFDRWRELSALGHAAYDPVTEELSARTDAEETNYLALNLADEVIRGRRSAVAARYFYDSTLSLSYYGKSSPYMTRLLFSPRRRAAPKPTS
ncbi:MAG: hypothetical protein ACHQ2Z_05040 [Elusimicrobiota bacterium]